MTFGRKKMLNFGPKTESQGGSPPQGIHSHHDTRARYSV